MVKRIDPERTIFTERLILRPLEQDDASCIAGYMNPEVLKWLPDIPWPYHPFHAESYVTASYEKAREGSGVDFWIVFEGGLVGTISLDDLNWLHSRWRISILISQGYWGKWIMTESMTAVIEYAFRELWLNKIFTGVIRENRASFAVLEKLGFSIDGSSRAHYAIGWRFFDETLVSLLAKDYLHGNGE